MPPCPKTKEAPMGTVAVELQLDEETAARLTNPRRLAAVTALVKLAEQPTDNDDPLIALLEQTSREAATAGLTDAEINAQLAAWKTEQVAKPHRSLSTPAALSGRAQTYQHTPSGSGAGVQSFADVSD